MGEGDGDEIGECGRRGRGRVTEMKLVKVGEGEERAEQAGKVEEGEGGAE